MEQLEAIAFLMGAVAIITAAFRRMEWNPVLGLIGAGVAMGPHGFGFVEQGGALSALAELGIMFLLFLIGLELSATRIKAMARYIFGLGASHYILCAALIGGIAWVIGEKPVTALVLGIALAMSSTAFVLQTLTDTGQLAGNAGRKSFSVLLFQDLMVAPILAALPLLMELASKTAARPASQAAHHSDISLPVAVIAMGMIFVVARLVLQQLVGSIHEDERSVHKGGDHGGGSYFFAAVISVALGMGIAAHHLGLSASLGAFLAGLALSGAEWRHDVKETVQPLESTFLGIFFISLGAQVPIAAAPLDILMMAAAAVAIIAVKAAAGFAAAMVNGSDKRESLRIGLILAQGGEFAFIVVAAAGAAAMSKSSATFWTGAAVLSLVATPLLVKAAAGLRRAPAAEMDEPEVTDRPTPMGIMP